jgi:hypothetical protein
VPAVGGQREIPAPDPIARDYLLLALRLDQRSPGLVDAYIGPADLKAQVDMEQLRSPAGLGADASALRERVSSEVDDPARRAWLTAQLEALETQSAMLAGERLPYPELVRRAFDRAPVRRPDERFVDAAAELDRLLPGDGSVADRLEALDAALVVDPERLPGVVDWQLDRLRARSSRLFGLPEGESVHVGAVRNQPWTAYNWYLGGRRSRIDLNVDLPVRLQHLVLSTLPHETYPGHHTERAIKEARLIDEQGRLEASAMLINTPECLISEGLADLGRSMAVPEDEAVDVLVEAIGRAALPIASDAGAARALAEAAAATTPPRRILDEVAVNAALLRHADEAPADHVLAYLERFGLLSPERAAKRLEFIDHPLWRTYVFVYYEGEDLLRRWVDAVPAADRPARFGRLLREQLTPSGIEADLSRPQDPAATT